MYNTSLFLRVWAVVFGLLGAPVALFTGGFSINLLWVAMACLVIAVPLFLVVVLFGNAIGNFLFGLGRKGPLRDQLASDVLKAKHALAEGRLVMASEIIDGVLVIDSNFGEALLIKAQVALRNGDVENARVELQHILKVCEKGDVNRRWALNYLRELSDAEDVSHL